MCDRHLVPSHGHRNWCLSSVEHEVPADVETTYWMGFNEPNNLHNCHTDAATVAKAWGRVMQLHPHSELVSPATAGNGIPWYDDFFGNCTKLYGSSGCRISYLATHCYSCTPSGTLRYFYCYIKLISSILFPYTSAPCGICRYLKKLYDRYHYKVWLTEFSCGDHADGRPTIDHLKFMKAVLPCEYQQLSCFCYFRINYITLLLCVCVCVCVCVRSCVCSQFFTRYNIVYCTVLDGADFVERYSWMSARDTSGMRGLIEDGPDGNARLTELGAVWNSDL
jgi:hypothetical protein